jgi:translation initiation factor 2 beta subunit (eIF-2beta)/eIF-5
MNTLELRTNFHNLIDSINNDRILSKFYTIMVRTKESNDGILWARLSKEEQDELIQADIDSYDPMNLIPQNEIMEKHKKWL